MVIEAGCSGITSTLEGLIDHWGWGQGWDMVVTLPRWDTVVTLSRVEPHRCVELWDQ